MRPIGRWVLTHLATAALLILTVAGGYVTLWQRPPASEEQSPWAPALVRALESGPGEAVAEPLVEATFGAGELPAEDAEAIFYRLTLSPGAGLPYLAGPLSHGGGEVATAGVGAEAVLSGAYAVRLDAPVRVRRGGAAGGGDEVPAGTEVVLGPGEAVVYPDYGASGTVRNAGDGPVVLVGVAIVARDGPKPTSGSGVPGLPAGVGGELFSRVPPALPAGPVRVGLWRLTLPAGGSVGPYDATGQEALRVERGAIARGSLRPGEASPRGRPLFRPAGTTAPFAAPAPGGRRVVASEGDQPAELLAASIDPAGLR